MVNAGEDVAVGVVAVGENVEGKGGAGEVAVRALEPDVVAVMGDEVLSGESLEDGRVTGIGDAGDEVADVSRVELGKTFHGAVGGDDAPGNVVERVDDERPDEFATPVGDDEADGVVEGTVDEDGVVGEGERGVGDDGGVCVRDEFGEAIGGLAEQAVAV